MRVASVVEAPEDRLEDAGCGLRVAGLRVADSRIRGSPCVRRASQSLLCTYSTIRCDAEGRN